MSEYIDIKKKLQAFVAAIELQVPSNGIIEQEYLDYFRKTFKKKEVTLILGNLGVMKLNKNQYEAAINIFETAIRYDDYDPHLHFLLGIALCQLEEITAIQRAKKELFQTKKLLEKKEPSDYREQHLAIINRYLGYFDVSIPYAIGQMFLKESEYYINNYGQIGAVGNQNDVKWFNSSDN
ncbi:MAG: hypothetical protein WCO29_22555 [Nostocales cyanobacterium ELA583]|jgi:tetratricopeptide (TPR) repeat protein